jgi:hypothetical protein
MGDQKKDKQNPGRRTALPLVVNRLKDLVAVCASEGEVSHRRPLGVPDARPQFSWLVRRKRAPFHELFCWRLNGTRRI